MRSTNTIAYTVLSVLHTNHCHLGLIYLKTTIKQQDLDNADRTAGHKSMHLQLPNSHRQHRSLKTELDVNKVQVCIFFRMAFHYRHT